MKAWARRESRLWLGLAAAVVLHELIARVLDRAELVERLLSPWGADLALALIVTLLLYALRFALLFVAPGWLLARAVIAWFEARRRR